MKASNVLKYFIPKEKKFYGMFNNAADNIIEASNEFVKLINAPTVDERNAIGVSIKSIERKGDEYTSKIFDVLHVSFITPFDREDITELTSALDDIVDLIYSVSSKIELYQCTQISTYMKEMVAQINQGCIQIQIAVKGLETMNKDNISKKACKEIKKIENAVDDYYHKGISSLFENEKNPIELIKQKEILQNIEKIANKIEDVSDTVKTILVKYA